MILAGTATAALLSALGVDAMGVDWGRGGGAKRQMPGDYDAIARQVRSAYPRSRQHALKLVIKEAVRLRQIFETEYAESRGNVFDDERGIEILIPNRAWLGSLSSLSRPEGHTKIFWHAVRAFVNLELEAKGRGELSDDTMLRPSVGRSPYIDVSGLWVSQGTEEHHLVKPPFWREDLQAVFPPVVLGDPEIGVIEVASPTVYALTPDGSVPYPPRMAILIVERDEWSDRDFSKIGYMEGGVTGLERWSGAADFATSAGRALHERRLTAWLEERDALYLGALSAREVGPSSSPWWRYALNRARFAERSAEYARQKWTPDTPDTPPYRPPVATVAPQ